VAPDAGGADLPGTACHAPGVTNINAVHGCAALLRLLAKIIRL
jgi:hypothetical protein